MDEAPSERNLGHGMSRPLIIVVVVLGAAAVAVAALWWSRRPEPMAGRPQPRVEATVGGVRVVHSTGELAVTVPDAFGQQVQESSSLGSPALLAAPDLDAFGATTLVEGPGVYVFTAAALRPDSDEALLTDWAPGGCEPLVDTTPYEAESLKGRYHSFRCENRRVDTFTGQNADRAGPRLLVRHHRRTCSGSFRDRNAAVRVPFVRGERERRPTG